MKSIQPETDDIIFPLNEKLEETYDIRIIERIQSDDGLIVVLKLRPFDFVKTPIFKGEVTMNTRTNDVLKVVGEIARDDVKLIGFSQKDTEKKNYQLTYDMTFKKDSLFDMVIDYIKIDQEFDYYNQDVFQTNVKSSSNLTFFEYYQPTSKKRLGVQFRRGKSDWQKLNQIGYNEKFWSENPIVKRTPSEEKIITSFEVDNAFENIFLNSKERIASLQHDISNDPKIIKLDTVLNKYNETNPIEKVYIQTNKDVYFKDEELWYSAFVTLGSFNYFSLASDVLHIDLIDDSNNLVVAQTQALVEGRSKGSMRLPKNLKEGNYWLRAYTNWMRNFDNEFFFNKKIQILDGSNTTLNQEKTKESNLDLQFFPEGGHLVANLSNKVAFKAIGNDGLPKDVKGKIVNSKGEHIVNITSLDRGAGFFVLEPQKGETYKAILNDNSSYNLPLVDNVGYVMTVNNSSLKSINLKIQASKELFDNEFYVIGHNQNFKYYQGKFKFNDRDLIEFDIPTNRLPSGVFVLTLMDANMQALSERILFINNSKELVITTNVVKDAYKPREKVEVNINVTDVNGVPVEADLAVSVNDVDRAYRNELGPNILTHFLLQSNIKGVINNPAEFFQDQKRSTIAKLDLIMLTNGWRKLDWSNLSYLNNNPKEFEFLEGFSISGNATSLANKPLSNIKLNVIAHSNTKLDMYSTTTDSRGRFELKNIVHKDSVKLVFNTYRISGKSVDANINLDDINSTLLQDLPIPNSELFQNIKINNEKKELIEDIAEQQITYPDYSNLDNINELDEVEVFGEANNKDKEKTSRGYLSNVTPDNVLEIDDTPGQDFVQQLGSVSGLRVTGTGANAIVSIRGQGNPLWVIDGIPLLQASSVKNTSAVNESSSGSNFSVASPTMSRATPIPDVIASMNTDDIQRIEVLKGGRAAIYGMYANNGVILVYTKSGNFQKDRPSPEQFVYGYSGYKEFYSPKYNVKLASHNKPDYRSTLYFNPSVRTDEKGNAKIIFYNSDIAKQFQVIVEGMSTYGLMGYDIKFVNKE
jgi:TonB-dependent SusC/RagA subfamily outer membrane receptor